MASCLAVRCCWKLKIESKQENHKERRQGGDRRRWYGCWWWPAVLIVYSRTAYDTTIVTGKIKGKV